jgi:hypothetical protein
MPLPVTVKESMFASPPLVVATRLKSFAPALIVGIGEARAGISRIVVVDSAIDTAKAGGVLLNGHSAGLLRAIEKGVERDGWPTVGVPCAFGVAHPVVSLWLPIQHAQPTRGAGLANDIGQKEAASRGLIPTHAYFV